VSIAAITLYVVSQRVFALVIYCVIDSVRKLFDTPSYCYVTSSITHSASLKTGLITTS
jgi:hypothetical protein